MASSSSISTRLFQTPLWIALLPMAAAAAAAALWLQLCGVCFVLRLRLARCPLCSAVTLSGEVT